ncbi:ABC-2 family transporter protein [compost metagenome]
MQIWLSTAYYELIKYSRMRSLLVIMLLLPLLLILLLGSALDTTVKPAKVALYQADQGVMSESIEQFWSSDETLTYIQLRKVDSEHELRELVEAGEVDFGVHVPADFSKRLTGGEHAQWNTYAGRYADKNIAAEAMVTSYMTDINLKMAAIAALGPGYTTQADELMNGNQSGEAAVIKVGTLGMGEDHMFGPVSSLQYYAAAYLIMFLLFGGMAGTISLLDQKENGTMQRMYALPASFKSYVFGIIMGSVFLAALQAVVVITFTKYVYSVEWGKHFGWITLICLLTTIAGAALGLILASYAKTRKATQSLYTVLLFVMTFLSGGMVAGIESVVGLAGKLTINFWANKSLRAIMSGNDVAAIIDEIGVLAIIAVVLTVIAVIRLPKVVKQHG